MDKSPLEFQSRALTDDKLRAINNKLYKVDWIGQLSSDGCDNNFNIYSNILNEVMDEVAPLKTVQISAKRQFKEPWMSKDIEASNRKNSELYKATLRSDATAEIRNKYVSYRNNYNHIKKAARLKYYKLQVEESKTNTKRLWQVINTVINKRKNKGSIIPYITVEGICIYDSNKIAD